MLQYSKSRYPKSTTKFEDLPTATKTTYSPNSVKSFLQETPFTSTKSHQGKTQSRYSSGYNNARKQIDGLIQEFQDKNKTNKSGIQRVRSVNQETLDILNESDHMINLTVPQLGHQSQYLSGYRNPQEPRELKSEMFSKQSMGVFSQNQHTKSGSISENYSLKLALKQKQQENCQLMNRIAELEDQKLKNTKQTAYFKDQVPSWIFRQLEQLKQENDALRKQSFRLLNNPKIK